MIDLKKIKTETTKSHKFNNKKKYFLLDEARACTYWFVVDSFIYIFNTQCTYCCHSTYCGHCTYCGHYTYL